MFIYRLDQPLKRQKTDPDTIFMVNKGSNGALNTSGGGSSTTGPQRSPLSAELDHDPYEFSEESSNAGIFGKRRSFPRPASISRQVSHLNLPIPNMLAGAMCWDGALLSF